MQKKQDENGFWTDVNAQRLALCLLAAFLSCLFIFNFYDGERFPFNDGLGYDGAIYADLAQRKPLEIIFNHVLFKYYAVRVLPSMVIHMLAKWAHYDITTNIGIIRAFYVFNGGFLLCAAWLATRIGKRAGWTGPVMLTFLASLFFNFAVLKYASLSPTMTDISGLCITIVALYAWQRQSIVLFATTLLIGSFIWPTTLYTLAPILFFWQSRDWPWPKSDQLPSRVAKYLRYGCAAFIAIMTVGISLYLYLFAGFRLTQVANQVNAHLLCLSAPLLCGFLFLAMREWTDPAYFLKAMRQVDLRYAAAAIVIFFAVMKLADFISNHQASPLSPTLYIKSIMQGGLVNPLINVVAHTVYFGPVAAVAILFWRRIQYSVRRAGPGITAFFLLSVYLMTGTESRQFLPFLPFAAYFVANELNRIEIDWFFAWSFTGISLIVSRFWMTINLGAWNDHYLEFPDQMLMMYSGPWMSSQVYPFFLATAIVIVIAAAALLRPYRLTQHND